WANYACDAAEPGPNTAPIDAMLQSLNEEAAAGTYVGARADMPEAAERREEIYTTRSNHDLRLHLGPGFSERRQHDAGEALALLLNGYELPLATQGDDGQRQPRHGVLHTQAHLAPLNAEGLAAERPSRLHFFLRTSTVYAFSGAGADPAGGEMAFTAVADHPRRPGFRIGMHHKIDCLNMLRLDIVP